MWLDGETGSPPVLINNNLMEMWFEQNKNILSATARKSVFKLFSDSFTNQTDLSCTFASDFHHSRKIIQIFKIFNDLKKRQYISKDKCFNQLISRFFIHTLRSNNEDVRCLIKKVLPKHVMTWWHFLKGKSRLNIPPAVTGFLLEISLH